MFDPTHSSAPTAPLDRSAFSVVPRSESGHDLAYWLTRSVEERLAASRCKGRSSMADPALPPDFSEFLKLLNTHRVD